MENTNFDTLMARYEELQAAQKAIEEELEQIRGTLKKELDDTGETKMIAGGYRINKILSHSTWFDQTTFKKEHPRLGAKYMRTKEYETLRIQKVAK